MSYNIVTSSVSRIGEIESGVGVWAWSLHCSSQWELLTWFGLSNTSYNMFKKFGCVAKENFLSASNTPMLHYHLYYNE